MNCRELTELLVDYLDDELPRATRNECRRHLASCPNCTAYLASYQTTVQLARAAFQTDNPAPVQLVSSLIGRFSV